MRLINQKREEFLILYFMNIFICFLGFFVVIVVVVVKALIKENYPKITDLKYSRHIKNLNIL